MALNKEGTDSTFSGVHAISVQNDSGDVKVSPSSSAVRVQTTACWGLVKPTLVQQVQNGVLTVSAQCPRDPLSSLLNGPCYRGIVIAAPPQVDLNVVAAAGDVSADGMAGAISLQSAAGDVSATATRSDQVHAATAAGNAAVDAVKAPREVIATTDAGQVNVTVPAGAYAVDATTVVGGVSITGLKQDASASNHIVARSVAGDVRIVSR